MKKRKVWTGKKKKRNSVHRPKWALVAKALEPGNREVARSTAEQLAFIRRVDDKSDWSVRQRSVVYTGKQGVAKNVAHVKRTTDGRNYGLFAAADIPAGAVVMPYFGDAMTHTELDHMPWADRSRLENYSIPHHIDDDRVVVGTPTDEDGELALRGNSAKHFGALINDPHPLPARANVITESIDTLSDKSPVPAADIPHHVYIATKRIRAGEEFLYDYGWSESDWARVKQNKPALPTEQHVMALVVFEMLGINTRGSGGDAVKRAFAISAARTRTPHIKQRLEVADYLLGEMGMSLRDADVKLLAGGGDADDTALDAKIDAIIAPEAARRRGGGFAAGGGATSGQTTTAAMLRGSSALRAAGF